MSGDVKLTHTSALILQTVGAGYLYGFDIMEATGLPSGTVYPALRRLEQQALIHSRWEKESKALAEQRPARKYYRLTAAGERALAKAVQRYPLLQHITRLDRPKPDKAESDRPASDKPVTKGTLKEKA
jgi:PadR family transcriptional regulator PadR